LIGISSVRDFTKDTFSNPNGTISGATGPRKLSTSGAVRALRAETKVLADALFEKAGMPVEALVDLNTRIKTLRDTFRASEFQSQ
jgi:hypothetical protein